MIIFSHMNVGRIKGDIKPCSPKSHIIKKSINLLSSLWKECGFVETFICFKQSNASMIFRYDHVLGTFLQSTQPVMTKITILTCGTVGPPIGLFPLTDSFSIFSFSNSFVVVKLVIKMPLQNVTSM